MSHKEPYNAPAAVFVSAMADDDDSGHFASRRIKLPAADEPRQAKATGRTRRGSGNGHTPPYQNPRTYTPSRLMVYRMGGEWNWTYPPGPIPSAPPAQTMRQVFTHGREIRNFVNRGWIGGKTAYPGRDRCELLRIVRPPAGVGDTPPPHLGAAKDDPTPRGIGSFWPVRPMRGLDEHRMSKCCVKNLSGKSGKYETLQNTNRISQGSESQQKHDEPLRSST